MRIRKEDWLRYEAANYKKRRRSALLTAIHAHVTALRESRRLARIRPNISSPALRLERHRFFKALEQERAAEAARKRRAEDIRQSMIAFARVARKAGYSVRASKGESGRVSSYYLRRDGLPPIRLSDHYLPSTPHRQMMSELHGGGSPFKAEIVLLEPVSQLRARRMLILADAGRI